MLDQSLSALLEDLEQRGLLNETVVIAKGEFGRHRRSTTRPGADHWQQVYSAIIAGGGLRGGQVIGQSDSKAEYPVSRPVTPADLFTTALHQLGHRHDCVNRQWFDTARGVIEELT